MMKASDVWPGDGFELTGKKKGTELGLERATLRDGKNGATHTKRKRASKKEQKNLQPMNIKRLMDLGCNQMPATAALFRYEANAHEPMPSVRAGQGCPGIFNRVADWK